MLYIPLNPAFFLLLFNLWFFFYFKRLYPEKIISEKEPDTPHTPKRFYPLPQKSTGYQILRKDHKPEKPIPRKDPTYPEKPFPKQYFPWKYFPPIPVLPENCFPVPRIFYRILHPEKRFSPYPEGVQDLVEDFPEKR